MDLKSFTIRKSINVWNGFETSRGSGASNYLQKTWGINWISFAQTDSLEMSVKYDLYFRNLICWTSNFPYGRWLTTSMAIQRLKYHVQCGLILSPFFHSQLDRNDYPHHCSLFSLCCGGLYSNSSQSDIYFYLFHVNDNVNKSLIVHFLLPFVSLS